MSHFIVVLFNVVSLTILLHKTQGEDFLVCSRKGETFSSTGPKSKTYYYCNEKDEQPVEEECPDGLTFWQNKNGCYPDDEKAAVQPDGPSISRLATTDVPSVYGETVQATAQYGQPTPTSLVTSTAEMTSEGPTVYASTATPSEYGETIPYSDRKYAQQQQRLRLHPTRLRRLKLRVTRQPRVTNIQRVARITRPMRIRYRTRHPGETTGTMTPTEEETTRPKKIDKQKQHNNFQQQIINSKLNQNNNHNPNTNVNNIANSATNNYVNINKNAKYKDYDETAVNSKVEVQKCCELKIYSVPVLGRTVYLGDFYNAKTDEIYSGHSLWKPKTIEKRKISSIARSSTVNVFSATTTGERLNRLDFTPSLKMDYLAGLLSVSGSAAYLKDTVESEDTLAVILKYRATTHTETLPTLLEIENDLCDINGPTHVVSNIKYGMGANFVFKKTTDSKNKDTKLQELLNVVLAIPTFKLDESGNLKINKKMKSNAKGIDMKLFADYVVEEQPTNYDEAIQTFQDLTKQLGDPPKYAGAAKMEITLVPITRYCPKKNVLVASVSNRLIDQVIQMMTEIEATKQRATALGSISCIKKYTPIKKILTTFMKELNVYELSVKSHLQTIIPNIRKAGASEKKLENLLLDYTKSPFYTKVAENFLNVREREIEMLNNIIDHEKLNGSGIKVMIPADSADGKIIFEKRTVLTLKLNILPRESLINSYLKGRYGGERHAWFFQPELIASMGKKFNKFVDFAATNVNDTQLGFLLVINDAKDNIGKETVTMTLKRDGQVITPDFRFPGKPAKLVLVNNNYAHLVFSAKKCNNPSIIGIIVRYHVCGKCEDVKENAYRFTNNGTSKVEIEDLREQEPKDEEDIIKQEAERRQLVNATKDEDVVDEGSRQFVKNTTNDDNDLVAPTNQTESDGLQQRRYKINHRISNQSILSSAARILGHTPEHEYILNGTTHSGNFTATSDKRVTVSDQPENDVDDIPEADVIEEKPYSQITEDRRINKQVLQNKYIAIIDVRDLMAGECYKFSMRYITQAGVTPSGKSTEGIITVACTPPQNIKIEDIMNDSFNMKWDAPEEIGGRKMIGGYQINITGTSFKRIKEIHGFTHARITDLEHASSYIVSVQCITQSKKTVNGKVVIPTGLPISYRVLTRPEVPRKLKLRNYTVDSAFITWHPPKRIAEGAIIITYHVKYSTTLDNALYRSDIFKKGTEFVISSGNKTHFLITDLVKGAEYEVTVKVLTSKGSSMFVDPPIRFRTKGAEDGSGGLVDSGLETVGGEYIVDDRKGEKIAMDMAAKLNRKIDKKLHEMKIQHPPIISTSASTEKALHILNEKLSKTTDIVTMEAKAIRQTKLIVANITGSIKAMERHSPAFYPEYRAWFMGLGAGNGDTEQVTAFNLEECLRVCYKKRLSDNVWNGVRFYIDFKTCYCERENTGHTYIDKALHYYFF